jgi:predicted ester cyclase
MGIAPTGRDVVLRISDIVRMVNGKAVERWGVEDMSGLFSQHS